MHFIYWPSQEFEKKYWLLSNATQGQKIWGVEFFPRLLSILIHSAYPQSRMIVIIVFAHVVRTYVPTFQTLAKQNKCSLLARLWVWPSGSLMTPVLFPTVFGLYYFSDLGEGRRIKR